VSTAPKCDRNRGWRGPCCSARGRTRMNKTVLASTATSAQSTKLEFRFRSGRRRLHRSACSLGHSISINEPRHRSPLRAPPRPHQRGCPCAGQGNDRLHGPGKGPRRYAETKRGSLSPYHPHGGRLPMRQPFTSMRLGQSRTRHLAVINLSLLPHSAPYSRRWADRDPQAMHQSRFRS
jgi:hypothetical protein